MEKVYLITDAEVQRVLTAIASAVHPNATFSDVNNIMAGLSQLPENVVAVSETPE